MEDGKIERWKMLAHGGSLPRIPRINTDFFEHETRRRPTDQREVISRITRIFSTPQIPRIDTDFVVSFATTEVE